MNKPSNRITKELQQLENEHHDSCSKCAYVFKDADTTHLGYLESGEPAYLCNKCSTLLKEVAKRQYFMLRPFEVPPENSQIWRYMDFTKFVSLLSSKSLYFTRSDQFEDLFEGAKGFKMNKDRWDSYYLEFFRNAIRNPPPGHDFSLTDFEVEERAYRLLAEMEIGGRNDRVHTYIEVGRQ